MKRWPPLAQAVRHPVFVIALLGAISGWATSAILIHSTWTEMEVHEKGHPLISPLLECSPSRPMAGATELMLERKIRRSVRNNMARGSVRSFSIYFRDLNNGPWLGVNNDEEFTPGSMMKVPLMMAYLRAEGLKPGIMREKIAYQVFEQPENRGLPQYVERPEELEPGTEYTVEKLIEHMILFSDNNSAALLFDHMDPSIRDRTYTDLGIEVPKVTDWTTNFMTVKDYATFFRILFFASYLGREASAKGLDLLTRTTFVDGLVAGLPRGTRVAHKFGIRNSDRSRASQLHDCGIVYVPTKPYLLCVMTKGEDLGQQAAAIAEISATVYDAVTRPYSF